MTALAASARLQEVQATSTRAGSRAPAHVVSAVQSASARTGVDFSYLMEKAAVESSFKTDAKASSSSATGLFQFIESTWLNMVEQHGAKYGLARQAAAIKHDRGGDPYVSDPVTRQQILDLRKDPRISALMAGELVKENKERLESELDRPVGKTELYLAHFLGAGGATRFLKAMDRNPDKAAATLLPEAARANRNVFFDRNGKACSLCEVFDRFAGKFGEEGVGDGSPFGVVKETPTEHQPWFSTRSAGTAKEPMSTFTAMILSQLAPPLEKEGKGRSSSAGGNEDEREGATPNLFADMTTG